jgi:class 3 adenylate cyclase/pSer/pThr/pTyr-binding forkhead associated (FHA) protein
MIKLRVRSPISLLWRPESEQWALRVDRGGEETAPVRATPFVIGRGTDCHLLLPNSPDLDQITSRWHCHIVEESGRPMIVDGSLLEVPGFGARKPSVTGTWVNGQRLKGPRELKEGDKIAVGPWTFVVEEARESPVDIDEGLEQLGAGTTRTLPAGDPRIRESFARLHELTQTLNRTANIEENLISILNCAVSEVGCAEVAAILIDEPNEGCSARVAWQRGLGRISDFRFSADLVRRLPKDRGVLVSEGGVEDPDENRPEGQANSAVLVPLWGTDERLGILYLDNRQSGASFTEEDLFLADALASYASLQLLREKEVFLMRVASSMSQYFGPQIVQLLVEEANQGRPMLPEVKEQTATILFVDLTGFSRYCRGRSPREVSELLNPYLQLVAECIQRHSGHVDKFIGDGVLGVFGALPLANAAPGADHARQAVRAAREIISLWATRSTKIIQILLPIRAGINTGRVVVGNIGFAGRMEYSVIGDPVNLASRMEKLALPNGIALTDATRALIEDEFKCVDAGIEAVRGFGAVRVWRVSADLPA